MATSYVYDPKTQTWVPSSSSDPGATTTPGGSKAKQDHDDGNPSSPSTGGTGGSDAQIQAEKEYIELEFKTLEGELTAKVSKKSIRIKVNDTVRVEGIGKYLSGLYFVSSVKRVVDSSGGYSQTLTLIKTGFGDSLKNPDSTVSNNARSTPIHVSAPTLRVGDSVKVVGDAVYANKYDGVRVPMWMKKNTFTIGNVSSDSSKVLLKEANMWVYSMYVQKA